MKNKIVWKLWLMMMALVSLTVAFIWIGQIFFFEQNYAKSTLEQSRIRMRPIMESLQSTEWTNYDHFLPLLSRIANGIVILFDDQGDMVQIFDRGYPADLDNTPDKKLIDDFRLSEEFSNVLTRTAYEKISYNKENLLPMTGNIVRIDTGFPVIFDSLDCYMVVSQAVSLELTLNLNRNCLTVLCIVLTLSASVIAAVFSRHFTRPIYQIKDSIDRMTDNDYTHIPKLRQNDEIGEVAKSVKILSQSLQRVDRLGKEVIANVSHELRSPLSLISGYAEMVRDIDWKDEKCREEDLNLIIEEALRLSEMVNDILDYSQLQAGCIKLNREIFNLVELTKQELTCCTKAAGQYRIAINLYAEPDEISVCADELKLRQVLRNLLYNAVNHTPEDHAIQISIKKTGDQFRFSVSNPSEPLSDEELKTIWDRYMRSQHMNGRTLGTGIGLSIVRSILEAHEMRYGADCADGMICFWFEGTLL